HSFELLLSLGIAGGPVPLSIAAARAHDPRLEPGAHRLLVGVTTWCVLEAALGVVLGAVGWLELQAVLVAEAALLIAGSLALRREPSVVRRAPTPFGMAEGLLLVLGAIIGLTLVVRLAVTPITEHDSLAYHLPVMAAWAQTHRLVTL